MAKSNKHYSLKLSYLNFAKENVSIKFFSDGHMVYQSNFGNNFVINHGFDLSKLEKGKYNVMLATADEEYWFSVTR